ncbi:YicC/YloC family endoribonuclease [Acidithiobacillus montserratensis]|uniref:YicC/YloC family endoribonuclease n=1 Tax=Acidithiobacillus montserratensis TaxID=2729135 RepID=A0ACD5HCD3_9PROT|nr:YicC/YloC family endoribonuclease [Acidithiobacillus montserratensis]MBN2680121.1 YicC family protein [Acidithiobacillaceae bacterium]MBU2748485.1 YicC family protein [Acidithiobacillus montserratensis]
MIRSMTGFARSERHGDWGTLVWELRTVNHRYLDINLRLPEGFSVHESAIRARLQKSLLRGRVDVWLRFQEVEGGGLRLNRDLAGQLQTVYSELLQSWNLHDATFNPLEALRWPGLVQSAGTDSAILEEEMLALLDSTLAELQISREREGAALAQILLSRVEAVAEQTRALRAHLPEMEAALRQRLQARLGDLALQVDPQRWEQEILFYLQRQDTAEELDRLDTHLAELRRILARREAVGRRLDFLMQELNREANTLASKAADSQVTFASVELKVLIEQMREQVQNVE